MAIKVIDLFAGPGGLGEGFSAYKSKNKHPFKIAISIEKEASAHRTLTLRALFRQFPEGKAPEAYYAFLRGELGKNPEDQLYKLPEVQKELVQARKEAQQITLGQDDQKMIYGKIREALGKDDCVLIGGPPCQAYSIAGRARNMGEKTKTYNPADDHRNFLYKEYLKIIAKFQPKVFVMENVKGMLSAKVDGKLIFDSIRNDLQDPCKATKVEADKGRRKHKYRIYSLVNEKMGELSPRDFIIEMEKYGLPQARHRVIILGIREDVANDINGFKRLKPSKNNVTVRQVISDMPKLRSRLSKQKDSTTAWRQIILDVAESKLKALSKDDLVKNKLYDNFVIQLNKIKSSPVGYGADKGQQSKKQFNKLLPVNLATWYKDAHMKDFVVNHETRGHLATDLCRYLYYSTYASLESVSPKANNLPMVLWPNHKNFGSGKFTDRFRVQLKNAPATTITSHISKDGHYYIHYDPVQCRSLTVREAARIQTFPDNYYFVGNRTQQYVQVGNAVPPFLAKQIAKIIASILVIEL